MEIQIDGRIFKIINDQKDNDISGLKYIEMPIDHFDLLYLLEWDNKVKTSAKHEYARDTYYNTASSYGILQGAWIRINEERTECFLSYDSLRRMGDKEFVIAPRNAMSDHTLTSILFNLRGIKATIEESAIGGMNAYTFLPQIIWDDFDEVLDELENYIRNETKC